MFDSPPTSAPSTGAKGLEDVIAFDTELCHIDGARGLLLLRGLPIEQVAELGFERAAALLWEGRADDGERLRAALGDARARAHARLPDLEHALSRPDPMDGVRAALACSPPPSGDFFAQATTLTAAVGVFVAAWHRQAAGLAPIAPDEGADHATDLLRLLGGDTATPTLARGLGIYLATVVEHGVNASTFAARTVASTAADLESAVIAGMCALKGPLHGGAPGPVLDMLDAIATPDHAEPWLRAELAAGRRIMGMGHRVYRARDPRAAVFEAACRELSADNPRIGLARAVEKAAERLLAARHPTRPLRANVEFFTAVLLEAVGIHRALFTAMFAAGRVVGWCAHADEQRRTGRLIRPRARYVGPRAA